MTESESLSPPEECGQHIGLLVAGLDSKLNELRRLLPRAAIEAIDAADAALTECLRQTRKAVECHQSVSGC